MSKSAIKFMVSSGIMAGNRYGRQSTFATNRTQQRLRPQVITGPQRPVHKQDKQQ